MEKLCFIAIVLYFFLKSNIKRKRGWKNPSSLLFLIYFGASALAIPYVFFNDSYYINSSYELLTQDIYWIGTFVFVGLLFLFFFPLYYFKENEIEEIKLPNIQILDFFSLVVIVLSLYSIFFYLPSVISMFSSGYSLATIRNNLSSMREGFGDFRGIANTIASVSASLYPFAVLLFYIYYIIGKRSIRTILLLVSSLSNIIRVLAFVGRDGVVYWIMTFAILYFLFRNYLNIKQKKKIKRVIVIGAFVAIIPFIAISVSRFSSDSGGAGTLKGILAYSGQMTPNYLLYYNVRENHYNYGAILPLYWELVNELPPDSKRWIDGGTESNVFGTFLKSFNANFGVLGTILVGLLCGLLFVNIFKSSKKTLRFHQFFVLILFLQVLSEGIFYFREYTRGGNLYIIICLFLFLIFGLIENCFGVFTLVKNEIAETVSVRKKLGFGMNSKNIMG